MIVVVACILKFGFPMFQKMQKKIDNVNRVVQENLIGMRVVKAYVREDREKDKFHDASDDLVAQGAKAAGPDCDGDAGDDADAQCRSGLCVL